jgi:deoxyribose-phosphate aldolase
MNINQFIEHTLLHPLATREDVARLCDEAVQHNFCGVCVPPFLVRDAFKKLEDTSLVISTVIGFPLGYTFTNVKVEEMKKVIDEGAQEMDVVINISAVKCGEWSILRNEIDSVTTAAHMRGKKVKMILEVDYLEEKELGKLLEYCAETNVDFVKTSTGYSQKSIRPQIIERIREALPENIGIKASGGVRDYELAKSLVKAGASRLGCSASIEIIKG